MTNNNTKTNQNRLYDAIEDIWQKKDTIQKNTDEFLSAQKIIDSFIDKLNLGHEKVVEKITTEQNLTEQCSQSTWITNEYAKKAIILKFKFFDCFLTKLPYINYFDKINSKFLDKQESYFKETEIRAVPNCYVRHGAYIGKNVVLMPSFVNIGAHIGDGTMIDTWATVGSCAYIGKNCHISGGAGIGGVLEPISQNPVIIEDNCFIGARSEIAEGVKINEGSVISMGVFISSSTKIVDRNTGEIIYGEVPPYSVVIPGCISDKNNTGLSISCAVIIKKVDDSTRKKVSINEILRD